MIGSPNRAQGAIRLPDNAQRVEVELLHGGGRLVLVLRCEVWRGRSGLIVATWDPGAGSVEVVLDTWDLRVERDYGCTIQALSATTSHESMPSARRYVVEGVVVEVVKTRG